MPKAKKRKPVNFVVLARDEAAELYEMLDDLVCEHHDELAEARIALAWRFGWKADPDGRLQLGQCRKASELDRLLHEFDFIILLNHEVWHSVEFSPAQKLALLDHELCHAAMRLEDDGEPVEDQNGRKVYRIRKHTIEEFHEIVQRHGLWKADIASFAATAMEAKRLPLLAGEPAPAARKAILRAVADLSPADGSLTISAGGNSVTLTPETKRGAERALRAQ